MFCNIVVLAVFVYLVIKRNKESDKRQKILKSNYNRCETKIKDNSRYFKLRIKKYFEGVYFEEKTNIKHLIFKCERDYKDMLSSLSEMGSINNEIKRESNKEDLVTYYLSKIRSTNNKIKKESNKEDLEGSVTLVQNQDVKYAESLITDLKKLRDHLNPILPNYMIDLESYGTVNKTYFDSIHKIDRINALKFIENLENAITEAKALSFDSINSMHMPYIIRYIWFFAMEQPYSASDFQNVCQLFYTLYRKPHIDVILAEIYAKRKLGGDYSIDGIVRYLLGVRGNNSSLLCANLLDYSKITYNDLVILASGLMWMNAYHTEYTVLQHMLSLGMEMTPKMQERLHALANGGGKSPDGLEITSQGNTLYFDLSSLAWRDEDYTGLFENLAFKETPLTYSLAIKDENKELFISQGVVVPEIGGILNKINDVFNEEYGNSVTAKVIDGVAVSGSGEETLKGILAISNECKQMGILIYITRIGKKLIIKFYTLFIPVSNDIAVQKQQALSIYKNLSPTVTMWESSLKDTMLMAVEQLVNVSVQQATVSEQKCIKEEVETEIEF